MRQLLNRGALSYHQSNSDAFYPASPKSSLVSFTWSLLSLLQDIVTRYASASGRHVTRRFGWDCHGLPVEYEIDKKLGGWAFEHCVAAVDVFGGWMGICVRGEMEAGLQKQAGADRELPVALGAQPISPVAFEGAGDGRMRGSASGP